VTTVARRRLALEPTCDGHHLAGSRLAVLEVLGVLGVLGVRRIEPNVSVGVAA
jgi:hypothetical protein